MPSPNRFLRLGTDGGKVGRTTDVRTGRVVQHGDIIHVGADLTNLQDNTEIWGEHYERKASEILSLQEQIAKRHRRQAALETQQRPKAAWSPSKARKTRRAYQLYVKGRYYWNKRAAAYLKTAISCFNQAIDKDPAYALPDLLEARFSGQLPVGRLSWHARATAICVIHR